jgi:hypothetical protein
MHPKARSRRGLKPARASTPIAASPAAVPLFAAAPRPHTWPSTTAPENGSSRSSPRQRSAQPPALAVPICPKRSSGSPPCTPRLSPQTLARPGANSSSATRSNPSACASPATTPASNSSSPTTLGVVATVRSSQTASVGSSAPGMRSRKRCRLPPRPPPRAVAAAPRARTARRRRCALPPTLRRGPRGLPAGRTARPRLPGS